MTRLPRCITWLVQRVVPADRALDVTTDLEDEYLRRRHRRMPSWWWLARETSSVLAAYAMAPLGRLRDSTPVFARDLRFVLRGLRRGALPALGAASMLSTGMLAALLTAGLAQSLLFRQVSATHGAGLRRLGTSDRDGRQSLRLAFAELQLVGQHVDQIAPLTVVNLQPVVLRALDADIQTMAEVVDGHYFGLVGMGAVVGRPLLTTDDHPGAPPVAVIAEPFWRRRFAGSVAAIGQTIQLNSESFTVVGVARATGSSSFLGASVDVWLPLAHADAVLNRGWRTDLDHRWFSGFLLAETGAPELDAHLAAASADLATLYPDHWRHRRLQMSEATVVTGGQRRTAEVLMAVLVGLTLLILVTAAANAAGLMLARALGIRRHVAVHLSLGSGRAAIVRRQVIEGSLLGLGGAAIAVACYLWTRNRLMEVALLPTLALRLDLPVDWRLLLTVVAGGAGIGAALALGPAIWATRPTVMDALRDGDARSSAGRNGTHLRRLLVAAQVGLALSLIVGAALFQRSLDGLHGVDIGFPRDNLVAMDFDFEPSRASADELPGLAREALRRAQATPGVAAAAMTNRAPVDQSTPSLPVRTSQEEGAAIADVTFYLATADYFDTVGLPLVAGRSFTAAEAESSANVVIVNETLAARIRPGGDVVDRVLHIGRDTGAARVIGVAKDSRYRSLSESSRPHLYQPTPAMLGLSLIARTTADPGTTLRNLQRTLDQVGPGLVGFFPRTLEDHLAVDLLPTRAAATAATTLGVLALALSAVGLYGLVAWFVELRRREIGVRMALGASPGDVRRLVVGQAVMTALPGVAAGLILSALLASWSRSALYEVGPLDPIAVLVGIVSVVLVVTLASYLPSRRAARVDPALTLRSS